MRTMSSMRSNNAPASRNTTLSRDQFNMNTSASSGSHVLDTTDNNQLPAHLRSQYAPQPASPVAMTSPYYAQQASPQVQHQDSASEMKIPSYTEAMEAFTKQAPADDVRATAGARYDSFANHMYSTVASSAAAVVVLDSHTHPTSASHCTNPLVAAHPSDVCSCHNAHLRAARRRLSRNDSVHESHSVVADVDAIDQQLATDTNFAYDYYQLHYDDRGVGVAGSHNHDVIIPRSSSHTSAQSSSNQNAPSPPPPFDDASADAAMASSGHADGGATSDEWENASNGSYLLKSRDPSIDGDI